MAAKKGVKKATRKKAVAKPEVIIQERIVYMDKEPPLSDIDVAGALNVPKDDRQRRAIFQILEQEIELAAGLTQGKAENHGKLAEMVGWHTALRFFKVELESYYNKAAPTMRANASDEAPQKVSSAY